MSSLSHVAKSVLRGLLFRRGNCPVGFTTGLVFCLTEAAIVYLSTISYTMYIFTCKYLHWLSALLYANLNNHKLHIHVLLRKMFRVASTCLWKSQGHLYKLSYTQEYLLPTSSFSAIKSKFIVDRFKNLYLNDAGQANVLLRKSIRHQKKMVTNSQMRYLTKSLARPVWLIRAACKSLRGIRQWEYSSWEVFRKQSTIRR